MSNEQGEQRRQNLEALIRRGVEPYPYRYEVSHRTHEVREAFERLERSKTPVSLAGRLMAIRSHGKSTFAHLQDEGGRLQVYFKLNVVGEEPYEVVRLLDVGDVVGVKGPVFRTRTDEMTLDARELTFLANCLTPLDGDGVLGYYWHTPEPSKEVVRWTTILQTSRRSWWPRPGRSLMEISNL